MTIMSVFIPASSQSTMELTVVSVADAVGKLELGTQIPSQILVLRKNQEMIAISTSTLRLQPLRTITSVMMPFLPHLANVPLLPQSY